jgi:hypothetical protein
MLNQIIIIYYEPYFLNINDDVSNKLVCFNHPWKCRISYVFQIATPIVTYKNPKLIIVYFLEANGTMCRNGRNCEIK